MSKTNKHIEKIRTRLLNELKGNTEEKLSTTPVQFSMEVELLANSNNCLLIEALAYMTEIHSLEPEKIGKFITEGLKEKLAIENGIKKQKKGLPL